MTWRGKLYISALCVIFTTILTLHRFKIDQQNKLESDDLQLGNYVTDPRIFGEKNKILNELNGKNIMSTTIVTTTINFRKLSVP